MKKCVKLQFHSVLLLQWPIPWGKFRTTTTATIMATTMTTKVTTTIRNTKNGAKFSFQSFISLFLPSKISETFFAQQRRSFQMNF